MATLPINPQDAISDMNKAKAELEKAIENLKNKPHQLTPEDLKKHSDVARAFFDINGIC